MSFARHRAARSLTAAAFLLLALFASVAGAALPPGVTQEATVEGITEYRLANGLQVLLFPDQSKPTITVNVTYLVGSRHEGYGETGMAHLLEAHAVQGHAESRRHRPGVRRPRRCASTARPRWTAPTTYETVPGHDENLEWALSMEADRMVNSLRRARRTSITEMTVVRNEYERGENSPSAC